MSGLRCDMIIMGGPWSWCNGTVTIHSPGNTSSCTSTPCAVAYWLRDMQLFSLSRSVASDRENESHAMRGRSRAGSPSTRNKGKGSPILRRLNLSRVPQRFTFFSRNFNGDVFYDFFKHPIQNVSPEDRKSHMLYSIEQRRKCITDASSSTLIL